ncbi:MAG: CbiX/SirB N-terminal domain-containing protein [Desulfosarcinaceae bacterium]|jgi:sirohydrochlorin ferrochelatase
MKALLIAAHGSRQPAANAEIASLSESIAAIAGGGFDRVRCAFLQLTDPLIPDVIAELVAGGADEIVVFPFFIAAGSHVKSDIPDLVAEAREAYPEVVFRVAPHLGASEGIARFILNAVCA